jgi:formamidopyrimidine-DNA glycosylase
MISSKLSSSFGFARMPELPEVETICAGLRDGLTSHPSILGKQIISTHILWQRSIETPSVEEFTVGVQGNEIRKISRRGKFIVIHLNRDYLIIHLRMSGDLFYRDKGEQMAAHDRIIFNFAGGGSLVFNDTRKFGRIWLVSDLNDVLGDLGPEPFDPALSEMKFYKMIRGRSIVIKKLLLDQKFLAGIGNIYADEALFLSRLHPLTMSNHLDINSSDLLLHSIRTVLQAGIHHHGASIDWVYKGGDFQNHFRVYKRTGTPCLECGTAIERILVGQRSTHYCPNCQKQR